MRRILFGTKEVILDGGFPLGLGRGVDNVNVAVLNLN